MIKHVKNYLFAHKGNNHKPHLLRERSLGALVLIGLVLFCTSLGSSYVLNKTDFGAAVVSSVLVDLTNQHRIENNGKALTINPALELAAYMKAKDMADNQYFAHTSPTGVTPWQWFSKAGYNFLYAGENLAINFSESIDVESAWIASPTHNANLISAKFDETGIATYQGIYNGRQTVFVVQLFGKKAPLGSVSLVTKAEAKDNSLVIKPEVKGESTQDIPKKNTSTKAPDIYKQESAPVLILDEPLFVVAQNIDIQEPQQNEDLSTLDSYPKYSTLAQRLLVNQAKNVQLAYLVIIALVYLVLIGMVIAEFKVNHIKNIALSILLLCLLSGLAYINSSFVLSFI